MEARRIMGYFGEQDGRSVEGPVMVTYTGGAKNKMLSMAFEGHYRVTVPYGTVEQLMNQARLEVRKAARQGSSSGGTVEPHGLTDGYCTDSRVRLRKGATTVWFRTNGQFEMLTVSYEERGQISVPFAPVLALVKTEQSSYA